jgi:hypothetical protein
MEVFIRFGIRVAWVSGLLSVLRLSDNGRRQKRFRSLAVMMDRRNQQFAFAVKRRSNRDSLRQIVKRTGMTGCTWLTVIGLAAPAVAQDSFSSIDAAYRANDFTVPQTRMRPIGAPSAVDQFRSAGNPSSAQNGTFNAAQARAVTPTSTADVGFRDENVRQAVLMQSSGGYAMPGTGLPAPLNSAPAGPINLPLSSSYENGPLPSGNSAAAIGNGGAGLPMPGSPSTRAGNPPGNVLPQNIPAQSGGSLAPVPRTGVIGGQATPGGDYAPMPQPQLGNQFATLGNCSNISAPSGYRSDRILTCGPSTSYVTTVGATSQPPIYSPPPAQIGPPVILPPTQVGVPIGSTQTVIPGPAGYRPLISFGQERYPVQIGQGIFGQPVAYVPGQTFRNALRYIAW